jgi:hypothetical protein
LLVLRINDNGKKAQSLGKIDADRAGDKLPVLHMPFNSSRILQRAVGEHFNILAYQHFDEETNMIGQHKPVPCIPEAKKR